jgi:[acyl-carrier-protein] S-malonyltransferase
MDQKIAFVFPGQGSQYIGMLSKIHEEHGSIIREVFKEASDVLNYDLWGLIQKGPIEKLNQTEFTQPALLTAGVAMWRIWEHVEDFKPIILAGHSLGEYTALVCAEALSLREAVILVSKRGQLMQSVAIPGSRWAMAAIIGLDDNEVITICAKAYVTCGKIVQAVNFNAPGQIVIAGDKAAVDIAMEISKFKEAKAVLLPISVPSHSVFMQPIMKQFAEQLQAINWKMPKIPVVHNFDVRVHQDANSICNVLSKQLCNPVRWVEIIQYIVGLGIKLIVECGPGKVLTNLNKRIRKDLQFIALEEDMVLGIINDIAR